MRLGGPTFEKHTGPDTWVAELKRLGYRAAYCPVDPSADDATVRAYARAAADADIVIAEVGAWSNTISPDDAERRANIRKNQDALALADRIGARCCVNIAGSRNAASWAGPHPDNFGPETFDLIVETVRQIIDAVRPTRTYYTLECMEFMPPYTTDNYVDLVRAIDRDRFAAHFDPVNLIWSPMRFYQTGEIIREFVAKLGPHIRSCHAKDIALTDRATVDMPEIRPGLGGLDYRTYLAQLATLDADVPLMLEHLSSADEYTLAAGHVRGVAQQVGVDL
ncbi:MAG TPA: sugar phosphate isomerase/epimerase [Phycisphaerae bacterium]|nr:sugar phosphate isomerase/epimerase [Phycisphaerae bacterium]